MTSTDTQAWKIRLTWEKRPNDPHLSYPRHTYGCALSRAGADQSALSAWRRAEDVDHGPMLVGVHIRPFDSEDEWEPCEQPEPLQRLFTATRVL